MTKYSYEISQRPGEIGGGWCLKLLEDGGEVGGGVFHVKRNPDHQNCADWWNSLTNSMRSNWMSMHDSPIKAYFSYLLNEAYDDAEATAHEWLDSRNKDSIDVGEL